MSDMLNKVCQVVEDALKKSANTEGLSAPITVSSFMNNPPEWDSLAFVAVFLAVTEQFNIEAEDDDAIHFTSIEGILDFIEEVS